MGESALASNISGYVISSVKNLLKKINKLNGFNILHQFASNVGSLKLGLQSKDLNKVYNSELLYLVNCDEVSINKNDDQFIIYQGSHGGENSTIAEVVLPSSSYTEKNGSFVNLEGRVQKSYKSSYPPGFAKDDWEIFSIIADSNNIDLGFKNFNELRKKMISEYPSLGEYDKLPELNYTNLTFNNKEKGDFNIVLNPIDYYQTNIIARSSKTMHNCKKIKIANKKVSA